MPIDSLEQRIDTNKRNGMETSEIVNFLKNDSNVQELGKKLETTFNSNWLDRQNNQKFYDAVENTTINNKAFQTRIENIVKKGTGGLTDTDVFLLYLQSKIDGTLAMKPIISKKGDIYTRYGGQLLLNYIRSKYKNPKYEFWRGLPDIIPQAPTKNKPKALIENQKRETKLPTNIDFSTFGENNTHMPKEFSKLDTRAKENFSTEYNKEKIASRKRNSEKGEKINDYIQYDLLIFSLKKYQELIEKKINGVTNGIYGNEQYCKLQQNLAKSYFQDLEIINKEFPDIQDIIKNISNYFKDLEKLQKKYLGNQKEEVIQKKYEAYLKEIDNKGKELGINEQGIPKEINKFEDVVKILENTEKIVKFQEFQEKIKTKYGKSVINNYEKYINDKGNLIKKHGKDNLQKWMDTYKKYGEKVNDYKNRHRQKGFDEKKYNEYIKKVSESDIPRHMENIQILSNSINIKDGKVPENFPIRSIKEDYERIQKEQAETDKRRENLKNKSRLLYQICNIGSRGINALVSSTRGTGAKLGALVSSLWHDDDEMIAVWERANNGFWNPSIPISTRQAQSAYEKGEIILNWDNGPGIVSEGIVSMLTLVAGGGAITKGLTKGATKIGIGMGTKLARGTGLVSSGFIQQAGPSFGEGLSAGMTGNQAMLYAITSATLQGSLELLSPNGFINGLGKNLAKTYIKEILKSESKQSLKAVGKLFLKNVGSEIGEEIIQEEVQLAAGNIINMRANNQYDLGKDGLKADWNRKNFAATAIVTALTTGFVAGGGFAMQSPGIGNNQNREQLIGHIQKNNELHSDVMNVLDKAIAGKFKIPNVDVKQLQELKGILISSTGNTNTGNLNLETQEEGIKESSETANNTYQKVDVQEYVSEGLKEGRLEIIEAEKSAKIQAVRGTIGQEVISWSVDEQGNPIKEKVAKVEADPETGEAGRIATKVDEAGNPIVDKNGNLNQWIIDNSTFNKKYEIDNTENGIYKAAGGIQKFVKIKDNIILDQWGSEFKIAEGGYINITNENDMYGISGRDFEDTYRIVESSEIKGNNPTDYFDGKSHQFEVNGTQARSNSENMDKILSEINEQNKSEKLEELRKTITEQYKESTGEELNLTDEQLLSILDAHEQDGKLGELTLGQLKQKVKILDETITDPKIRRFLLEAGFCGQLNEENTKKAINNILENTNLDMDIIYDIAAEHDITNKAIQDLIIICENNNLTRKIHILLKCCSENSNYEKLTKNEIEQRCNSIIKAIKNNISIDSIQEILYTYRNSTLEIINEIEKKVKENNNEQQKIQEYKNKLKDKYKNPKISPIIERILNNRDLPKEIIFYIDEIIGENPSEEVCISFEKYINEINLNEFTLSTTKIILKNKLGINNRENDIIGFLGLEKKGNGYTFNVDNDLKDIITNLYGTEIGETIIQKIGKELREQDLKNIQNILKKASKIININEIEPHKLILFYQNILDSDRDAHWLNTLSPEQCALILNNTKSKFIPKEILEIITEYTSIPRILNNGDNQTDLTKTMENYIETQQTNADTPCVRVEGFMPGRSKNDNFGGCLKSVNLGNEFGGKSMDIVLKYINGIQDETEKIKELKKLRNSILKNNYTATNERFMSCSLTGIGLGQHLGKDGIMRNFTIKKGTKALFLQGINTKGEDSIYEILVQKNSKIKITDISYAENHFIIYADVTN